jgi:hypothetical protein
MIRGCQLTQIVVAAKLRIADHLKNGPVTVRQLATLIHLEAVWPNRGFGTGRTENDMD